MSERGAAPTALVYNGETIRRRDEMLCLTDMWRASGSDPTKQPARWARMPPTQEFASHLAANGTIPPNIGVEAERGRSGGTWAHWQLGLAYAKYLSPAFHAWCNEVVRGFMEGDLPAPPPAPASAFLTAADLIAAFDAFGRGFRGETSAVVTAALEPVNHRLDSVETRLEDNSAEIAAIRMDVSGGLALLRQAAERRRRHFSSDTKAELLLAAHEAGGLCPCCRKARVTGPDGCKAIGTEFHHIGDVWDSSADNGVPLCKECHRGFTAAPAAMRAEYRAELEAFHKFRRRLPGRQVALAF